MRLVGLQWLENDPLVEGATIQMEKNYGFGFHVKDDIGEIIRHSYCCNKLRDKIDTYL